MTGWLLAVGWVGLASKMRVAAGATAEGPRACQGVTADCRPMGAQCAASVLSGMLFLASKKERWLRVPRRGGLPVNVETKDVGKKVIRLATVLAKP